MSNVFWLTVAQMARLKPFFAKPHGKSRVDDRRVLSGIIFINRNGLRWCDAPKEYGPHKTLYNRWKRWSEKGVFGRILVGLAAEDPENKTVLIDATYLKTHRTATSLQVKKGGRGRQTGRTKGGMNTKLHAVTDSVGHPIRLFITAFQVSDYIGARVLCESLPTVEWLIADRGHDADWFGAQHIHQVDDVEEPAPAAVPDTGARDADREMGLSCPLMPLETMLRICFLQQWYALSDPLAEEMVYNSDAI
jgi:transposase